MRKKVNRKLMFLVAAAISLNSERAWDADERIAWDPYFVRDDGACSDAGAWRRWDVVKGFGSLASNRPRHARCSVCGAETPVSSLQGNPLLVWLQEQWYAETDAFYCGCDAPDIAPAP